MGRTKARVTKCCQICNTVLEDVHPAQKYCEECANMLRRIKDQERYYKNKEKGICVYCGKREALDGIVACGNCRQESKAKEKDCVMCGKEIHPPKFKYCELCGLTNQMVNAINFKERGRVLKERAKRREKEIRNNEAFLEEIRKQIMQEVSEEYE